nr:MAG TPA: hypothetical protein [Caudoviricetes sp.]
MSYFYCFRNHLYRYWKTGSKLWFWCKCYNSW